MGLNVKTFRRVMSTKINRVHHFIVKRSL